jgi:hypothetical protein
MPQLNEITLTKSDGSTLVKFTPRNIQGGVAKLASSTGVAIADPIMTISNSQTAGGRQKVVVKIAVPVVQDNVVSGVARPTVVRTAYADVTLSFDGTSSRRERLDMTSFISDLMARGGQAQITAVVGDNEGLY